jgi:predicted deacylase
MVAKTADKDRRIVIGGVTVDPGERRTIDLPIANLYTHTKLTLPLHVINARHAGPTLFITAAIHGDELNGVNIVRRLLNLSEMKQLRGALLAVPIANVFGFIHRTRYLPDRRDLNRSFPGRETGSIAARLANLIGKEIVAKADYGIDLHTGAADRENLPQIRADLSDPKVLELAKTFGTPVILDSRLRDGSLREFAAARGIPLLLYEAGEAMRFDEVAIRAGVRGIRRVMRQLGMLPARKLKSPKLEPVVSHETTWVRAPCSGIIDARCGLGARVRNGDVLATVGDPFGATRTDVTSTAAGVVIGRTRSPLAYEGDALFHVAIFEDSKIAAATVEHFKQTHTPPDGTGTGGTGSPNT